MNRILLGESTSMDVEHDRQRRKPLTFQTRRIHIQIQAILILCRRVLKPRKNSRTDPLRLGRLWTDMSILSCVSGGGKRCFSNRCCETTGSSRSLSVWDTQEPECVHVTPALELSDRGVKFDLATSILKEEDTPQDAVEADCGELCAAGNPVCLPSDLVDSEAV